MFIYGATENSRGHFYADFNRVLIHVMEGKAPIVLQNGIPSENKKRGKPH